eukprot:6179562-Pleurochrysis_carterae.AAC.1
MYARPSCRDRHAYLRTQERAGRHNCHLHVHANKDAHVMSNMEQQEITQRHIHTLAPTRRHILRARVLAHQLQNAHFSHLTCATRVDIRGLRSSICAVLCARLVAGRAASRDLRRLGGRARGRLRMLP